MDVGRSVSDVYPARYPRRIDTCLKTTVPAVPQSALMMIRIALFCTLHRNLGLVDRVSITVDIQYSN